MIVRFMFLIIFAFLSSLAKADTCKTGFRSSHAELQDYGCKLEEMAADCRTFFYENPHLLEYSKDCETPNDNRWTITKWAEACKDAGIESWTHIWHQLNLADAAIRACDINIECKKDIAAQAFYWCKDANGEQKFPCTDPEKLAEVDIRDLLRKRDHVRELAKRDRAYKELILSEGAILPNDDGGPPIESVVSATLKEIGVRAQCFNSTGYVRMGCYALASVVDPAMLVGGVSIGTLKGARWISAVLKEMKAADRGLQTINHYHYSKIRRFDNDIGIVPGNLIKDPIRSMEDSKDWNRTRMAQMAAYEPKVSPGRKAFLNQTEADELFKKVKEHPVVGTCALKKYDPKKDIGFCFGRSTAVHIEALKTGVGKDAMKKAFVVGELKDGVNSWGYHVVTVVKREDGGWWAFDPIKFDKPVSLDEWIKAMSAMSVDRPYNLYFTDPVRTGPVVPYPIYQYPRKNSGAKKINQYLKDYLNFSKEEMKNK